MLEGDWEEVITARSLDNEVFGSPLRTKARRGRPPKSELSKEDKENVKPKASKATTTRPKPMKANLNDRPKRAMTRRAEVMA